MKKYTKEIFIEIAKIKHNNFYDYSLVNYINSRTIIKIICPIHGVFEMTPSNHIFGQKCKKCINDSKKIINFVEKANEIHNNKYDYSLVNYINNKTKIRIICKNHNDIFEQSPESHLKGFGCKICAKNRTLDTKEFIKIAKIKHNNFYDYSSVDYINSLTKIEIICPIHGMFEQRPDVHIRGKKGSGCKKCKDNINANFKKMNIDDFIKKSNDIHNNKYDYSLIEYKNSMTKIKIICPIHGIFEQTPSHHLNNHGCPHCKKSKGEKIIRNYLIENKINFIPQKKFNNCKYKYKLPFDFYLSDYNICIEYDGMQHYFDNGFFDFEYIKLTDSIKTKYCIDNNIRLIRIKYNEEIIEKLNNLFIFL